MIRSDRRRTSTSTPSRPTSARSRLSAAERAAGRHRAPAIIAVVKANAYGHGAGPVALALERAGATMLACADIEEAIVAAARRACAARSSCSAR